MTAIQRVEELCVQRGWSLYELSTRTNISLSTLYNAKNSHRELTNETIKRVCASFGITTFQFYHDLYDIPSLTDEQRKVLSVWASLEDDEKEFFKNGAELLLSNRIKRKKTKKTF